MSTAIDPMIASPLPRRASVWYQRGVDRRLGSLAWLLAILGCLQLVGALLPRGIDLTAARSQSLSPQTVAVLRRLEQTVEITVIAPTRPRTVGEQAFAHALGPFRDLVERCRRESPQIVWRSLDPEIDLAARRVAEEFPDLSVPGVVITSEIDGSRRHETLHVRDLAEIGVTRGRQPVLEFFGEQSLTAALSRLIGGVESMQVYCLTGHGELAIEDDAVESRQGMGVLATRLRGNGCRVESLDLGIVSRVPADADLVIIAGALGETPPVEIEKLRRYFGQGGRGLILMESAHSVYEDSTEESLAGLLAEQGVTVGHDRLVTAGFTGEIELASPVMPAQSDQALVRSLPLTPLILHDARSVRTRVGVEALSTESTPLLVSHTAPRAWSETDFSSLEATFNPESDLPGPVAVACAVERHQGDLREPVLVVVGDAEFVCNRNLTAPSGRTGANFVFAALHWLHGRKQSFADIPATRKEPYTLTGTAAELQRSVWGTAFFVCAALLVGVATTAAQRRA